MLRILGQWSDPLNPAQDSGVSPKELEAFQNVIRRFDCRCQYCGIETLLTVQTPLGFFDICAQTPELIHEPRSWVPLCRLCSPLNRLDHLYTARDDAEAGRVLDEHGVFINAGWISQGALNALVVLCGAITLAPEHNWGVLRRAAPQLRASLLSHVDPRWEEAGWRGEPSILAGLQSTLTHPFSPVSAAHDLRFLHSEAHNAEAIRFWSGLMYERVEAALAHAAGMSDANAMDAALLAGAAERAHEEEVIHEC